MESQILDGITADYPPAAVASGASGGDVGFNLNFPRGLDFNPNIFQRSQLLYAFLVNPNPNHSAHHKSSNNETLIKRLKDVPKYRRHFVMLRLQQCIITSSVEAEHNQWKAPYIQKSRRERPCHQEVPPNGSYSCLSPGDCWERLLITHMLQLAGNGWNATLLMV